MLTLLAPVVWLLAVALFPLAVAQDVVFYLRGYERSFTRRFVARHARRRPRVRAGTLIRVMHVTHGRGV